MSERFSGRLFQFDRGSGYGFVRDPDGGDADVFVHVNELPEASKHQMREGVLLEFAITDGDRGPRAVEVTLLEAGAGMGSFDFGHQLLDALIRDVPTLTAAQLGAIRDSVVTIANEQGLLAD